MFRTKARPVRLNLRQRLPDGLRPDRGVAVNRPRRFLSPSSGRTLANAGIAARSRAQIFPKA